MCTEEEQSPVLPNSKYLIQPHSNGKRKSSSSGKEIMIMMLIKIVQFQFAIGGLNTLTNMSEIAVDL